MGFRYHSWFSGPICAVQGSRTFSMCWKGMQKREENQKRSEVRKLRLKSEENSSTRGHCREVSTGEYRFREKRRGQLCYLVWKATQDISDQQDQYRPQRKPLGRGWWQTRCYFSLHAMDYTVYLRHDSISGQISRKGKKKNLRAEYSKGTVLTRKIGLGFKLQWL